MTTAAIPSALRRLRSMDAAELRFRASAALRNAMNRARSSLAPPSWDRRDLRLHGGGLDGVQRLLAHGDARGAHRQLATYFQQRAARFPLSPADLGRTAARIRARFPGTDAAGRADRVLQGRYDLLGYVDVAVGSPPDWHRDAVHDRYAPLLFWDAVPYLDAACGDHKVTWELNRHQHFLSLGRAFALTGDRRYYQEFVAQLASWMAANPPLRGINWASMLELAFRSLSWTWALHFFVAAAGEQDEHPWLVDLLLGIDRQLVHVEQNLSRYFSPNTHLTGEALALYVIGRALPELGDAMRRASIGRSILVAEVTRQINADGGHAELSAHYHRYSTDFYLLALNVARITHDPAAAVFEDAARRQTAYLRTIADDRGRLPLVGDDDGGQLFPVCGREPADARDSLATAAVLLKDLSLSVGDVPEETYWFCANHDDLARYDSSAMPWPSRHLDSSGYCVSRNDRGDHLIFDCGPHGFLNGGHAHSDALSIVLTVAGRPLLVDPGTASYTIDPEARDRFRSTAMHNTVVVNRRAQAEPSGPFHWRNAPRARCTAWTSRAAMDYAEGRHEAYAPIIHMRRVLCLHGIGWVIIDHLEGAGTAVDATAMWHVHPSWRAAKLDDHVVELVHADGTRLGLAASGTLRELTGPAGAYAPVYGRVEQGLCFESHENGPAPMRLVSFIPACAEWLPLTIDRSEPEALQIATHGGTLTVVSKVELEPVIEVKAGVAQSVHRSA